MSPNKISSPYAGRILSSLQWQKKSNDCGPYTTATVINALKGLNIDADQLARQMERPVRRGAMLMVRRIPGWATFPWGIVDVLRQYGLQASWRFFTDVHYLRGSLARGQILMPVVGSWRPPWAHVMTLVAWDERRGWGFANTQYSHADIHWLPDPVFQKQWQAMGRLLIEVIPDEPEDSKSSQSWMG